MKELLFTPRGLGVTFLHNWIAIGLVWTVVQALHAAGYI